MPNITFGGQIPKRTADGKPLAASSSLFPRPEGEVSDAQPLQVGDIIETLEGRRAQVTAVTGGRATLMLEHLDHDGGPFFTVQSSGSDIPSGS